MANKKDYRGGCLILLVSFLCFICQIVFLTLKLCGAVTWHWAIVLIPLMLLIGLPLLLIMLYVLVRLPAEVWRNYKRRKRVDAEAAQYGMERQPGETTGELKKRIIKRDMISGNYSRKDLKELLMNKFTDIASCSFIINNSPTNPTVVISVKKTDDFSGGGITFQKFTDTELSAILTEAVQYIPEKYQVTIKNKEIEEK
jgi:hypothetical protein